jgi:hypothetical protein
MLLSVILTSIFIIIFLYFYGTRQEDIRINSLRAHFSAIELGGIKKGGKLLLWIPGTWKPIVSLGCLLCGVSGFILIMFLNGGQIVWLIVVDIANIGICLAWYHAYWRPNNGDEVQIVDADGIRTTRVSRKGVVIINEAKWQDVSDGEITHFGTGDNDEIIGIELITRNGRILIYNKTANYLLLCELMSTTYLKRLFFLETSGIHSYLTQIGRPDPQEYLSKLPQDNFGIP